MARTPAGSLPKLRLHKRTGQSVVTLTNPRGSRRDYYLGRPGEESEKRYRKLLAEWIAGGNEFPVARAAEPGARPRNLRDLADRFEAHAESYYRRADGSHTGEHLSIQRACLMLTESFGQVHPEEFGPSKLAQFQDGLTGRRYGQKHDKLGREIPGTGKTFSRNYINGVVRRIKQMFRWAEANELVPAATYHRLATVPALKAGRSGARETSGLEPVTEDQVKATVTHLPRPVAALVWFCWHTGARMGEAVQLAREHVEMRGDVWLFSPPQHKTTHRGKDRVIPIGSEAQAILRPFLQISPDRPWFRPCDAVTEANGRRRPDLDDAKAATRQAKNARRRQAQPKRIPGDTYTTNAVQVAIRRACEKAKVGRWTPHMLRHAALSRIREKRGLEAAAAIGGHWTLDVTQLYTRAAQQKLATEVMRDLG